LRAQSEGYGKLSNSTLYNRLSGVVTRMEFGKHEGEPHSFLIQSLSLCVTKGRWHGDAYFQNRFLGSICRVLFQSRRNMRDVGFTRKCHALRIIENFEVTLEKQSFTVHFRVCAHTLLQRTTTLQCRGSVSMVRLPIPQLLKD
jgi:hypothetical protein